MGSAAWEWQAKQNRLPCAVLGLLSLDNKMIWPVGISCQPANSDWIQPNSEFCQYECSIAYPAHVCLLCRWEIQQQIWVAVWVHGSHPQERSTPSVVKACQTLIFWLPSNIARVRDVALRLLIIWNFQLVALEASISYVRMADLLGF